jgi:hypothetical protein
LQQALDTVYAPAGVRLTAGPVAEPESAEYGACRLALSGASVVYRAAKTTPTKIGQFVTLWHRPDPAGPIAPLDSESDIALAIIAVSDGVQQGHFVFDRSTLLQRGVMCQGGLGGKRAIRVYPPWTKPVAKGAIRTQKWQIRCFLPLDRTDTRALVRQLCASILPGLVE